MSSFTATIAAAGSLSAPVGLGNYRAARLGLPADIGTATGLSFQTSSDGDTWRDLYDQYGAEYRINGIAASRSYALDLSVFIAARYIKVRFGTSASPNTYASERLVNVACLA